MYIPAFSFSQSDFSAFVYVLPFNKIVDIPFCLSTLIAEELGVVNISKQHNILIVLYTLLRSVVDETTDYRKDRLD